MRSCVVTPFRKEIVPFSLEQKGWLHRKQRKRKEDHCATKNSAKPLQDLSYSIQSRLISCQSFVYEGFLYLLTSFTQLAIIKSCVVLVVVLVGDRNERFRRKLSHATGLRKTH